MKARTRLLPADPPRAPNRQSTDRDQGKTQLFSSVRVAVDSVVPASKFWKVLPSPNQLRYASVLLKIVRIVIVEKEFSKTFDVTTLGLSNLYTFHNPILFSSLTTENAEKRDKYELHFAL